MKLETPRFNFENIYLNRKMFEEFARPVTATGTKHGLKQLRSSYLHGGLTLLEHCRPETHPAGIGDLPNLMRIKCVPLITNGVWFMCDARNDSLISDYLDINCVDFSDLHLSILRTNIRTLCHFFRNQLNSTEIELTLGIKGLSKDELIDRLLLLVNRIGREFDNPFRPMLHTFCDATPIPVEFYYQYRLMVKNSLEVCALNNYQHITLQDLYIYSVIPIKFQVEIDKESKLKTPDRYPFLWFSKYWFKEELKHQMSFVGEPFGLSKVANILASSEIFGEMDIY